MRLIAFALAVSLIGVASAQESPGEGTSKISAPKKYRLLITEVGVAQSIVDMPLEDIAANYEKLRKSGDCTERRSFQCTIWENQDFEFIQRMEVVLLNHISARDGNVTRVNDRVGLGFGLNALLTSNQEEAMIKIDYQNTFVDELTPNTKTTDVKTHFASAEAPITTRKRLAIRIDGPEERSILVVLLIPSER